MSKMELLMIISVVVVLLNHSKIVNFICNLFRDKGKRHV